MRRVVWILVKERVLQRSLRKKGVAAQRRDSTWAVRKTLMTLLNVVAPYKELTTFAMALDNTSVCNRINLRLTNPLGVALRYLLSVERESSKIIGNQILDVLMIWLRLEQLSTGCAAFLVIVRVFVWFVLEFGKFWQRTKQPVRRLIMRGLGLNLIVCMALRVWSPRRVCNPLRVHFRLALKEIFFM